MPYLDHNATTPLKPEVRVKMGDVLALTGNASSVHASGRRFRQIIENSRRKLTEYLNAARSSVIFTSGATEANNMVLRGLSYDCLLVSAIEHPSVLSVMASAEQIAVQGNGQLDLNDLENRLQRHKDKTVLVSVMMVNSETGVIQPLPEIVDLAKKYKALVHTDAVQAIGRLPVDMKRLGVDALTLSAHKMGGPQGAGALILREGLVCRPLLRGGGQERGGRGGTENVAAIAGFGMAVEMADYHAYQKLAILRDDLEQDLKKIAPEIVVHGASSARVANTSNFSLPGVASDTQLIALDLENIAVSAGSACSSGKISPSHVLRAMGVDQELLDSAIRISLGWTTTEQDINIFLQSWRRLYQGWICQK